MPTIFSQTECSSATCRIRSTTFFNHVAQRGATLACQTCVEQNDRRVHRPTYRWMRPSNAAGKMFGLIKMEGARSQTLKAVDQFVIEYQEALATALSRCQRILSSAAFRCIARPTAPPRWSALCDSPDAYG
jgi:hypothetical protein